jgi:TolB-like protein
LKNRSANPIHSAIWAFFCLVMFCGASSAVAAPARVAILPFDINAEKDMTFLQEGIMDMLGSRLAWPEKVEVVNENETKAAFKSVEGFAGESRALLVGGKLQADYVLFGSLTVFGESVSIDAKMVDVSGQQEPLPFFAQTHGMGEVIPQINQFATNINATVFGRGVAQRPVAAAAPQAQAPQAGVIPVPQAQQAPQAGVIPVPQAQQAPQAYDPRMHPEKLLQSGGPSQTPMQADGQPNPTPNPAFVSSAATGAAAGGRTYWKSRSFKTLINGLDIGDVDNDGQQETVLGTENLISIYRMQNGSFVKVAEMEETSTSSYIGIDVADINGNGTPEIYVSSLGPKRRNVNSFVLEFDGNTYKKIGEEHGWLFRVAKTVDRGSLLIGQRLRVGETSAFNNPVHEMRWQGDSIVTGQVLLKGNRTNVIGMAYGDVTQTGQSLPIAYSYDDHLRIYSAAGEEIWADSERTGGNLAYYSPPGFDPQLQDKEYLPMRIRLTDIDRDGKTEVLVARHAELARNLTKFFRKFSDAQLVSKAWNGLALATQWKTQSFSGRASDFVVGDFDNDGADELVVAVVAKEGSVMLTDAVSNLIAFELKAP